jgi:hypothetical protein
MDRTGCANLGLGSTVSESTENMGKAPCSCEYQANSTWKTYAAQIKPISELPNN